MAIELRYSDKGSMFYVKCAYEEKDIPREAGFSWNRYAKVWCTPDAAIAERLKQYADEPTQEKIVLVRSQYQRSLATDSGFNPPAPDGLSYLPYQRAGIEWACENKRSMIADEMGLGKTIQAIGVMNVTKPEYTLIVCPASLKQNWLKECQKWLTYADNVCFRVMRGTVGHTLTIGKPYTEAAHTVVIVNYDVAWKSKVHDILGQHKWDLVVLDECHYLKNPTTNRTKGCIGPRSFTRRADRVVLLTGTPVTNRPIELFAILNNLAPHVIQPYNEYYAYGQRFCGGHKDRFGWNDRGASNTKDLNGRLRSGFMIRRFKKDVLKDLPDKRYQMVPLLLEKKKELDLVAEQVKDLNIKDVKRQDINTDKLGDLAKERHLLAQLKLPIAVKHIEDLLLNTDKVVVFAHHKGVIAELQEKLKKYNPVVIDGSTPAEKRQTHVENFQNDSETRVFIGQMQAAGVGLTLTAASTVVFVEFSWVPGEVTQAVDRCHRIGQEDSVLAQFLVIADSLEEHMMRAVLDKVKTINKVVG